MLNHPIKSRRPRGCVFVTVLWGEWHRCMFLDANLPTMLAPGNLPALIASVDCEYHIYTTAHDATRLRQNATFERLCELLRVSIELFKPAKTKDPITIHHAIWRRATDYARRRGALILLMAPDVVWADGSFARLRTAIETGKRAIFMASPRVVSETMAPAIAKRFPQSADQSVIIPPHDLLALSLSHLHPLTVAYSRSSNHFPLVHPEMILFPIKGDGFLLRALAREIFCFEPSRYALNSQALLMRLPPGDEIEFFLDSREFLCVSLTPLSKDTHWYLWRNRLDPLVASNWWLYYHSAANDYISSLNVRFTRGSAGEAHWRRAEQQASSVLAHLRSAREFMRIEDKLRQMGHWRAAGFLGLALLLYGLARRWPHSGRFIVLVPTDEAIERAGFGHVLGSMTSRAEARCMIEAHVAGLPDLRRIEDGLKLTTLSGQPFRLENAGDAQACGDNFVVPISSVLYAARPPAGAVLPEERPIA
jgi:hypothetical protein